MRALMMGLVCDLFNFFSGDVRTENRSQLAIKKQ